MLLPRFLDHVFFIVNLYRFLILQVAVLSDIHGNIYALKEVLKECEKEGVEQFLVLGDLVGYYYQAKLVLETLLSLNSIIIKGNHERLLEDLIKEKIKKEKILKKYGCGHQIAADSMPKKQLNYLFNLPNHMLVKICNTTFSLNHGSPYDSDEYLYPNSNQNNLERCNSVEADFVLVGHSHYAFAYSCQDSILLNVGSVGQNREKGGIASWALINSKTLDYKIMKTSYNVETLYNEVKEKDPLVPYNYNILKR